MKKTKIVGIRYYIMVLGICIAISVLFWLIVDYDKVDTYEISDFYLKGVTCTDTDELITTTNDPILELINEKQSYIENISLEFEKALDQEWKLQVFYTCNAGEEFTEFNSIRYDIKENQNIVSINVGESVYRFRIDLGEEEGKVLSVPKISVYHKDHSLLTRVVKIIALSLALFTFCFLAHFFYNNTGEKQKSNRKYAIIVSFALISVFAVLFIINSDGRITNSNFRNADYDACKKAEEVPVDYQNSKVQAIYDLPLDYYEKGIIYFNTVSENDREINIFFDDEGEIVSGYFIKGDWKQGTDYVIFSMPRHRCISKFLISIPMDASDDFNYDNFKITKIGVIKKGLIQEFSSKVTPQKIIICIAGILFLFILALLVIKIGSLEFTALFGKKIVILHIVLLVVLPIILLWNYLFGNRLYIFSDIASDSYAQYYPQLVFISDRLKNGLISGGFSFQKGLGDTYSAFLPTLSNWPALFGEEKIAFLMGVNVCLKMIIGGLLAYEWASLYGISFLGRFVIAAGYQFNAMFTVRSAWTDYPNVSLMVMLWLVGFELVFRKGRLRDYFFIALSSWLFFLQLQLYYCVLYGAAFLVYIVVRGILDKKTKSYFIKTILIYIPFAICGMGDKILNSFIKVLSSSRVSSGISSINDKTTNLWSVNWDNLFDALIRSVGIGIEGVSEDFVGVQNYLEGPAFYCGILVLLFIPAALYNLPKRKKFLYIFAVVISIITIGIDGVRLVISGFSGLSFKHTTFWIVIVLIIINLEAYVNIKKEGLRRGSLVIYNVTTIGVVLVMIAAYVNKLAARMDLWRISFGFIFIYCIIINLFVNYNIKILRSYLFILVLIEGITLSYSVINKREYLTKDQLDNSYYDDAYNAIAQIKNEDKDWYRIEKEQVSVSLCDSYIQRFYGTASYVGGVGINSNILNYYKMMGIPGEDKYLTGTNGGVYANALLGVKYIITNNSNNKRYSTHLLESIDSTCVYENELSLPLAYVYQESVSENSVNRLNTLDRSRIILHNCCVSEESESDLIGFVEDYTSRGLPDYVIQSDDAKILSLSGTDKKVILFQILYQDEDGKGKIGSVHWMYSDGTFGEKRYIQNQFTEIYADKEIVYMSFDDESLVNINCINLYIIDAEEYYSDIVRDINSLQSRGMYNTTVGDNCITGCISTDTDGILATSIPYNEKWVISIDGKKSDAFIVNYGFLGCRILKGEHMISIVYDSASWYKDYFFMMLGLSLLIILVIVMIIRYNTSKCCYKDIESTSI